MHLRKQAGIQSKSPRSSAQGGSVPRFRNGEALEKTEAVPVTPARNSLPQKQGKEREDRIQGAEGIYGAGRHRYGYAPGNLPVWAVKQARTDPTIAMPKPQL